jgi:hypothetical protein
LRVDDLGEPLRVEGYLKKIGGFGVVTVDGDEASAGASAATRLRT